MDVPFGRIVLFHFSSELKFWVVRGHMGLQSLSEKNFLSGSPGCERAPKTPLSCSVAVVLRWVIRQHSGEG